MFPLLRLINSSRSLWYPVRGSLLPEIRHKRLQLFKSIVGNKEDDQEELELTLKEFLMISTFYQMNLNYLLSYLDLVSAYGGVLIYVCYVMLQLCIGMPLYCLLTFMSSYAKRSFLKFWDCVPVFNGLGYTIGLLRFLVEVHSVMLSSTALLYILDLSRKHHIQKISKCEQKDNSVYCIPMYPTENYTRKCPTFYTMRPKNESCYVATQYYFRRQVLKFDEYNLHCCTINVKLAVASLFIWILVFSFSIFGLKRLRQFVVNIQIVFGIVLLIVAIYSISFVNENVQKVSSIANVEVDKFKLGVDLILHSAEVSLICNILYLGKLKPESLNARHAAFFINLIKVTLYLLVVCYAATIRRQIITYYKILDPRCLISGSHDIMFAFVPDILYRKEFGIVFVLLWYLGLFFFSLLSPILTTISCVDSITEKFKGLNKYRLFIFMAICFVGGIINVLFLSTNLSMAIVYSYQNGAPFLKTIILLLLSIALMFVYSTKRILDDYNFTFGAPPHKYWVTFWRTAPIFALFAFIFMMPQLHTNVREIYTSNQMMIANYAKSILFLLPFVTIFLAKCCKHVKYRSLGALTKPSEKWGPYNSIKRQARRYFYPQRDVKYRSNVLKCKHNCMNSSDKFYEENRRQNQNMQALIERKPYFKRLLKKQPIS